MNESEIIGIFYTIAPLVLLILRMKYVNDVCEEWNEKLLEYVKVCGFEKGKEREYYMRAMLSPASMYLRLDFWDVKDVIDDKLLLNDIDRLEYKKEFIKKRN